MQTGVLDLGHRKKFEKCALDNLNAHLNPLRNMRLSSFMTLSTLTSISHVWTMDITSAKYKVMDA